MLQRSAITISWNFKLTNLLSFDSRQLDVLIARYGLERCWINILGTHISGNTKFSYILESPEFADLEILESNIIEGLSIGEIGVLYEYCLAKDNPDSRKDNGQYFTPDDIARFMAGKASEFPRGIWLDPCSGIGNLSWHLVNAKRNKEEFLKNSLILADKDRLALFIARVLFTIDFQKSSERLFFEIQDNFKVFDFLSVQDSDKDSLFKGEGLSAVPEHQFVLVNPPYLGTDREDSRFETGKSRDLYAYFLENIIKTSKGFVSVTPQSFTNASKFRDLRRLLLENYSNLTIYNFDNIPGNVFCGIKFGSRNSNTANSIRAAIMIAKPGDGEPKITSLLRWRRDQRDLMFGSLDKFLSSVALTEEYFPKVSGKFESLYSEVISFKRLSSIMVSGPTEFVLHVPSSPRYFISALREPVSRSSMKSIYFQNKDDFETAYMLLNSSFMYWWWRVRDGGMTLSLETIRSLPVPSFRRNSKLIRLLSQSEMENIVVKKNAGNNHENVKHPRSLIGALNEAIIPSHSQELLNIHENSDLVQLNGQPG